MMADSLRIRIRTALDQLAYADTVDAHVGDVTDAVLAAIWPADPEPPGTRLRELLDGRMSQAKFAAALGVSGKHLCLLISGKATLTSGMALRLETATGVPAMEWAVAEAAWQDAQIRARLREVSDVR